jgi:hypothetical protein
LHDPIISITTIISITIIIYLKRKRKKEKGIGASMRLKYRRSKPEREQESEPREANGVASPGRKNQKPRTRIDKSETTKSAIDRSALLPRPRSPIVIVLVLGLLGWLKAA